MRTARTAHWKHPARISREKRKLKELRRLWQDERTRAETAEAAQKKFAALRIFIEPFTGPYGEEWSVRVNFFPKMFAHNAYAMHPFVQIDQEAYRIGREVGEKVAQALREQMPSNHYGAVAP